MLGPDMGQQATEAPEGIDRAGVEGWFRANVSEVELPLSFDRISGGRSNMTFGVRDSAGHAWALRRPPLGKRLGSAHDMGREHRVIAALQDTPVPVPPVVGLCEDEVVNGAPFYVMGFVEGPILRSADEADLPSTRTSAERSASGWSTPWSRSMRLIPTRSGWVSSGARRPTSSGSCGAGRASGRSRRRASWPSWTRSTSASPPGSPNRGRPPSSTATTGSTT